MFWHLTARCATFKPSAQSNFSTLKYMVYLQARSAAHQLGFTVEGADCILPAQAEQKPTQPAYVCEDPEDSRQEAAKIVARLSQELELPSKKLHATTIFANFLCKVSTNASEVCDYVALPGGTS